jgi:hypothetical protein
MHRDAPQGELKRREGTEYCLIGGHKACTSDASLRSKHPIVSTVHGEPTELPQTFIMSTVDRFLLRTNSWPVHAFPLAKGGKIAKWNPMAGEFGPYNRPYFREMTR